ncbi:transposase [Vibrio harveyi]
MPVRTKMVGIDLSLSNLFITDSGEQVDNPRHTKRYEKKLAYLQCKLAKKQKGSKACQKVAHLCTKITDS